MIPIEPQSNQPAGSLALLEKVYAETEPQPTPLKEEHLVSTTAQRNPNPKPTETKSRFASFPALWLAAWCLLGGFFLQKGWNADANQSPAIAATTIQPNYLTKPIQEIEVGQRVLAENPELQGLEIPRQEIDSVNWRTVSLEMSKADGSQLEITLLRPLSWLRKRSAEMGSTIHLDLEEMGANGPAKVLAILPCPEIEPGTGEIVTGKFAHSTGSVLNLYVDGSTDPIGTTSNHPFWSEDRKTFVPAEELLTGETLLTADGSRTKVVSLLPRPGPHKVYNLEVNNEHVYYVGNDGVLVHNSYRLVELIPNKSLKVGETVSRRGAANAIRRYEDVMASSQKEARSLAKEIADSINGSYLLEAGHGATKPHRAHLHILDELGVRIEEFGHIFY